jgi:hyperosmotically inducible periplasmic protein
MKKQGFALMIALALVLSSSATVSGSVVSGSVQIYKTVLKPDNTRENALLAHIAAPTADDQPNDRADRITAARVRRVIVADDTLSIYAHNVKIIVAGSKVTLAGPVHSNDERAEVVFDTASVVGAAAIINQITVV